ncbi:MAG: hypothetical protein KDC80_03815, partial [Saprospiraceae bacterium]|nr:hypothetical protein [Saprospiraceae bacterium]
QVFIYEGDNDISSGKTRDEILEDTKMVLDKIWSSDPETEIVLISPKPSVARWNLKEQYLALNTALSDLAEDHENLRFADVWHPALDENGMVMKDIFIQDNLHMNQKGYAIWETTIKPFLKDCK